MILNLALRKRIKMLAKSLRNIFTSRSSEGPGLIDILRGRRRGVYEKLSIANTRIKQLLMKIEHQLNVLDEREKILFDKLVQMIEYKDNLRANIIASEISQIRGIKKHLLAFSVVLENISIRIENMIFLGTISKDLPLIINVVKETRDIVKGLFPNMEYEFAVLEEDLRNITNEVVGEVLPDTQISYNTSLSSEAKKILEEAYLVAEEKIKSSLPKPDKDNKISLEETKGKIR